MGAFGAAAASASAAALRISIVTISRRRSNMSASGRNEIIPAAKPIWVTAGRNPMRSTGTAMLEAMTGSRGCE